MVLDRLRARFQEPVDVPQLTAAPAVLAEERADDIAAAEEQAEQLQQAAADAVAELAEELAALEGYEDGQGRTMVEDIVDNIVAERTRMVDELSLGGGAAAVYEEIDGFVDEFKTMKRKETEILKAIGDDKKPVFDALDAVKTQRDRLSTFLDGSYRVLERRETLEEAATELERLRERRQEVEEALDRTDLASTRERIEAVEAELEELHQGDTWRAYEELQEELAAVQEERKELRSTVLAAMNRMERGLKKLLYEADNGDMSLKADREILAAVRDGEVDAVLSRDPAAVADAVDAARQALPADLLGDRQREKFMDGAATLVDLDEHVSTLDDLERRAASLEEQVENHQAPEEEDEIAAEIDDLQDQLDEQRQRRKELRSDLADIDADLHDVAQRIETELQEAFQRGIDIAADLPSI